MKRKGRIRIVISPTLVLAVLAVVAVLAVYFIGPEKVMSRLGMLGGGEKVISADVQGAVVALNEMNTAEYVYTITETLDTEATKLWGINLPGTTSRVIFSYDGVIKAGIDFSKAKVEIKEAEKAILLRLPKAEVTSNELKLDSLQVLEERDGLFNKKSFAEINLAQSKAKEKALERAEENGLTVKAAENAKHYLEAFIRSLPGTEDYEIRFVEK